MATGSSRPTGPARPFGELEAKLRLTIDTVTDPHLNELLTTVLAPDGEVWELFSTLPAAKHYHQAYRYGLLEHSLTVAEAVDALTPIWPGVDRDLAVTGALLHDIGKVDTYHFVGTKIDLTDRGKLYGEISLGYYRLRREIDLMPDFPPTLADAFLHIILSHHGTLEHGSPVVPATREALIVHAADHLGAKLGSFDRVECGLPAGERWADHDRGLGTIAYFGPVGAQPQALVA